MIIKAHAGACLNEPISRAKNEVRNDIGSFREPRQHNSDMAFLQEKSKTYKDDSDNSEYHESSALLNTCKTLPVGYLALLKIERGFNL